MDKLYICHIMAATAVRPKGAGLFSIVPIVYVTALSPDSEDPSGWQSSHCKRKGGMLCLYIHVCLVN